MHRGSSSRRAFTVHTFAVSQLPRSPVDALVELALPNGGVAANLVGRASATATTVIVARGGPGEGLVEVGTAGVIRKRVASGVDVSVEPPHPPHPRLGQFTATSIAGNDLLSSVLYTAGICTTYAGKLAPVALALVSCMLYLFRFVYAEVVTAMPVNGGSYNALLNTTTKRAAAVASCLSLLAYIATAVVSAFSAVSYVQPLWDWAGTTLGQTVGTVSLLGLFAGLTIIGIGESAVVATAMFFTHVAALTCVVIASLVYGAGNGWVTFNDNMQSPLPDVVSSTGSLIAAGSPAVALYYGYAAALLGITGFETAANYVEEMVGSIAHGAAGPLYYDRVYSYYDALTSQLTIMLSAGRCRAGLFACLRRDAAEHVARSSLQPDSLARWHGRCVIYPASMHGVHEKDECPITAPRKSGT